MWGAAPSLVRCRCHIKSVRERRTAMGMTLHFCCGRDWRSWRGERRFTGVTWVMGGGDVNFSWALWCCVSLVFRFNAPSMCCFRAASLYSLENQFSQSDSYSYCLMFFKQKKWQQLKAVFGLVKQEISVFPQCLSVGFFHWLKWDRAQLVKVAVSIFLCSIQSNIRNGMWWQLLWGCLFTLPGPCQPPPCLHAASVFRLKAILKSRL